MQSTEYRHLLPDKLKNLPEHNVPEYTIMNHAKIDFVNYVITHIHTTPYKPETSAITDFSPITPIAPISPISSISPVPPIYAMSPDNFSSQQASSGNDKNVKNGMQYEKNETNNKNEKNTNNRKNHQEENDKKSESDISQKSHNSLLNGRLNSPTSSPPNPNPIHNPNPNPIHNPIRNPNPELNSLISRQYERYSWVDFGYLHSDQFTPRNPFRSHILSKSTVTYMILENLTPRDGNPKNALLFPTEKITGGFFSGCVRTLQDYQEGYHKAIRHYQTLNIADDDQALIPLIYYHYFNYFSFIKVGSYKHALRYVCDGVTKRIPKNSKE